ncbi:acyltransferase [Spirosoma montaniterrae]|uniref:Acetyltransferase n=1 Tax=Spirosoma montaniterrae TaxID=1178516 RepID=A0A1P9WZH6_9BACT|nr:acyltransferase [Spirosoma montaniterrae]AQG80780.1 acetyltransferase [Spirosoma montaniterrae]
MPLKNYLDQRPALKRWVHYLLIPPGEARPRRWVSWFVNPFIHQRHAKARIRSSVRLDVLPFNSFMLGAGSLIEAFSVVNNGVGPVEIGMNTLLGIGAVIIGPVRIGNNVIMAQHVVLSGLNHGYEDINLPIREQPVTTKPIVVEDDCWIGANVTITAGVTVGRHSVVAGGSVVTRDVPPFSVVGGNPARLLKQYSTDTNQWESVNRSVKSD